MTDLTEQWNKGELPEGDYYIKRRNGIFPYDNIDSRGVWRNSIDEDIVEVLAPVPSYEEWKRLKEFADYSIHNRDELTRQINFWMKENTKLKELLKECREISYATEMTAGNPRYEKALRELIKRINQALGEDK